MSTTKTQFVKTPAAIAMQDKLQYKIEQAEQATKDFAVDAEKYGYATALRRNDPLMQEQIIRLARGACIMLDSQPLDEVIREAQERVLDMARSSVCNSTCPYANLESQAKLMVYGKLYATLTGQMFSGL